MAKLGRPARTLRAEHDLAIEMRDGAVLRAEVYRPDGPGQFPVLLVRTPYGEQMGRMMPVLPAIDAGLAVVIQYCRGTGDSDGEFEPFSSEADDGADTVAWCARQPWSNGRVGMFGPSYLGMVQLAAAVRAPEALHALVPVVTPADYHWGLAYRQGAFQLGQSYGWHLLKSAQQLAYRAAAGEDVSAELPALLAATADPGAAYRQLPLTDLPAVPRIIPSWRDWLAHEARDGYWAGLSYRDDRHRIQAPALHVGGWFDLFLGGTLDNFVTLSAGAATEHARRNQRLIIGPWTHVDQTGAAGELHFGALASAMAIQLEQVQLGFLRHFLAGPGGELPGPRVKLFVMGANQWRDEDEWPLARTSWTPWYFQPGGGLEPSLPGAGTAFSRYRHDPADPVPTVGGATLMNGGADGGVSWLPGPRDQRAVSARPDVLTFTSPVLTTDVEVTGPVSVALHAATSAADTDFTAKLVDVWPDGRAMSVTDGIVRARYRGGPEAPEPVRPGECHEYRIDLIATSQLFRAGHRIRVDVASSNFPCYDRNPGSGVPAGQASGPDFVTADQTVFHDAVRPSHITLPVIPG